MKLIMYVFLTTTAFLVQVNQVQVQNDVRAIIEKAIQAQGGEAKVAKRRAMRIKVIGKAIFIPDQMVTGLEFFDKLSESEFAKP